MLYLEQLKQEVNEIYEADEQNDESKNACPRKVTT